jgi:F-type H+-transporting ATPase subunit b
MDFNFSTFLIEIANFLILIWILQRLFYKPLLAMIAQRKQYIEQTLLDAQTIQQQSEEQCTLYENRQKLWEQEKQTALSTFHQQMDTERKAKLSELQHELEDERQKHHVTLNRQKQEFERYAQQHALKNGAQFATMLLKQTASPELEARFIHLLLEHLVTLPEACKQYLQLVENQQSLHVKITTTYPIPTALQQQLEQHFVMLISLPLRFDYQQDASLISGLRIDIGAWVLQANLKHELSGFAELAYDFE